MFTEPWFWCPFCQSEMEEARDFPAPEEEWESVVENGEVLYYYTFLNGKCVYCGREWRACLGKPDDFSASHYAEIFYVELIIG